MSTTLKPRLTALERLVLGLCFVTHAAFFPWFPDLRSPNELTRVYLAEAMAEDHTVHLEGPLRRHGPILDLAVRREGRTSRYFSDKAPGVAFLATPFIATYDALFIADGAKTRGEIRSELASRVRIVRLVSATLPTFILLLLLMRFLIAELADRRLAPVLVMGYGLGTLAAAYANLAYGHQLSALLLFSLFLVIRKTTHTSSLKLSLATGALASAAVLTEYQNALLLLPFAIWYFVKIRISPRHLGVAILGFVPLISLLFTYHQAAFGSPFLTGYSFIASDFAIIHRQGLLGIGLPTLEHAALSFVSTSKGLFFFSPWLVLALPGMMLLGSRGDRRFMLLFAMLYALFVSSMIYPDGGWTVSQRHLAPMIPFLVLPVGLFIESLLHPRISPNSGNFRQFLAAPLLVGLLLPSILVCTLSAICWPHWQNDLVNPFWQLGFQLFMDGWVPPSLFSFMASWWLIVILLGLAALVSTIFVLEDHVLRLRLYRAAFALLLTALIAGAFMTFARQHGADRDVHRHRQFIESVYQPDPRSD
jgi:hypothetical protein